MSNELSTLPNATNHPDTSSADECSRFISAASNATPSFAHDTLFLSSALLDPNTPWQVHNCKINQQTVTEDGKLPFVYHYDALADELKAIKPLTGTLLKAFNTPMTVAEAASLLDIEPSAIPTPWFVKVMGTAVLACEPLQLALRISFTNTAKAFAPIYCSHKADALRQAMQGWHGYGDVYVLNKSAQPVGVIDDSDLAYLISPSPEYQRLPPALAGAILTLIDTDLTHTSVRHLLDTAIFERID